MRHGSWLLGLVPIRSYIRVHFSSDSQLMRIQPRTSWCSSRCSPLNQERELHHHLLKRTYSASQAVPYFALDCYVYSYVLRAVHLHFLNETKETRTRPPAGEIWQESQVINSSDISASLLSLQNASNNNACVWKAWTMIIIPLHVALQTSWGHARYS